MTQEVQPLTWSKRTNIEEHQQFFSKINEIIDNLAPTVDEAEAAIAQATAAIASANDAVATANAASAAASAAASQAQTAASTVAGYDTRMTAAESKNSQQDTSIAALQNVQADYVKKAGAAQTVTSQIMVPTTATGLRDTQIANGTRIQNDLDAYSPMVRTTGAQTIAGDKIFTGRIIVNNTARVHNMITHKDDYLESNTTVPTSDHDVLIVIKASDGTEMFVINFRTDTSGNRVIRIGVNDTGSGTRHLFNLVSVAPDGTVTHPWN